MKYVTLMILAVTSLFLNGCVSTQDNNDYDRVWSATQEVMQRNGLIVKPSRYQEDTLVAVSQVRGDFLNKSRVKVVAKIVEDQEGYYEPSIRVVNQMDVSEPKAQSNPSAVANHNWVNVGANESMEAQLYNEVMQLVNSRQNTYSGKAWGSVNKNSGDYASPEDDVMEETSSKEFTQETW